MSRIFAGILLFVTVPSLAQFTYTLDQSIPVEVNGNLLKMPWAGGVNSAHVNTIDLNNDSKNDLVIFDKTASRILTYVTTSAGYVYAPDYEIYFPAEIDQWLLLRDFNCDGRKDIFTSDPFGIQVFVNTTAPGGNLSWRPFNAGFPLLTTGFTSSINLKVNETDIPAIDDVDGDGDLDILNVKFVGVGSVEWHKNLSVERTGRCDSMQLQRITQNYGAFEECSCGRFALGQTCEELGDGRTQHAGGKALITIDLDNDGDREILFSEEECARVFKLDNIGTKDEAVMTNPVGFPATTPINFLLFPTPFLEDIDQDGLVDLVASPNVGARTFSNINFQRSLWYYRNTGTANVPNFTFTQDNFLQRDMIDIGDYSHPAFADVDGDNDEDMLVGIYARQGFRGSVYLFENTGTPQAPSFKFATDDFGMINFGNLYNIKPQVIDMNGDGKADLAFTATNRQTGETLLHFLPNQSAKGMNVSLTQLVTTSFQLGQTENLTLADADLDGVNDILLGTSSGALRLYKNNGPLGNLTWTLVNSNYLSLQETGLYRNVAVAVADLDADGLGDLVATDRRGNVTIFGDFRNFDPAISQPATQILYNELSDEYNTKNLGTSGIPTVVNLFNSDKPALVVGTVLGGLYVLRNDEGKLLPEEPFITLFPNPMNKGEDLGIRADRNVLVQVFSILGQKMSEPVFIPANQIYPLKISNVASGIYIARFTFRDRSYARKFVIR